LLRAVSEIPSAALHLWTHCHERLARSKKYRYVFESEMGGGEFFRASVTLCRRAHSNSYHRLRRPRQHKNTERLLITCLVHLHFVACRFCSWFSSQARSVRGFADQGLKQQGLAALISLWSWHLLKTERNPCARGFTLCGCKSSGRGGSHQRYNSCTATPSPKNKPEAAAGGG
jgi:hypothetical protein